MVISAQSKMSHLDVELNALREHLSKVKIEHDDAVSRGNKCKENCEMHSGRIESQNCSSITCAG